MSEACSAKGDPTKATILRRCGEGHPPRRRPPIRVEQVGPMASAINQYREALTYFQDAYCIESRLAVRLAEVGKMDEAEEHYRRAYELMPDSFGRVESHCFGCEKAFEGEKIPGSRGGSISSHAPGEAGQTAASLSDGLFGRGTGKRC